MKPNRVTFKVLALLTGLALAGCAGRQTYQGGTFDVVNRGSGHESAAAGPRPQPQPTPSQDFNPPSDKNQPTTPDDAAQWLGNRKPDVLLKRNPYEATPL